MGHRASKEGRPYIRFLVLENRCSYEYRPLGSSPLGAHKLLVSGWLPLRGPDSADLWTIRRDEEYRYPKRIENLDMFKRV